MRSQERKGQTMAGPSFLPILQWKKKSLRILLLMLLPENCTILKKIQHAHSFYRENYLQCYIECNFEGQS